MTDIIKPKRPSGPGWRQMPDPPQWATLGFAGHAWRHDCGLYVISALEVAKQDGVDKGPEFHISITMRGERCSSADALWTVAQFDLDGAEEDNHVPDGRARNFWRPVADRFVGIDCACKDDEAVMREEKGDYVWRGVAR